MLKHSWQLQDAKNKFSQLVDQANNTGPQIVTRHGKEVAVVLSIAEYKKLVKPQKSLLDFFRESPLSGSEIDLERKKEFPRDIKL